MVLISPRCNVLYEHKCKTCMKTCLKPQQQNVIMFGIPFLPDTCHPVLIWCLWTVLGQHHSLRRGGATLRSSGGREKASLFFVDIIEGTELHQIQTESFRCVLLVSVCLCIIIDSFYIALLSALEETHCSHVRCDSKWVTVSKEWVNNCWCLTCMKHISTHAKIHI